MFNLCFLSFLILILQSITSALFISKHQSARLTEGRLLNTIGDNDQIPSTNLEYLQNIILLQGEVSKGYGRGSKKLGVPTANLPQFDSQLEKAKYPRGVYFGWGRIRNDPTDALLPCVANIGVSPTFVNQENPVNIVEAHFLDCTYPGGDFYGQDVRLSLVGFLRPEKKFGSLDALIAQINEDISNTRAVCAPPLEGIALKARRISESFLQQSWDTIRDTSGALARMESVGERALWGVASLERGGTAASPGSRSVSSHKAFNGWTPDLAIKKSINQGE